MKTTKLLLVAILLLLNTKLANSQKDSSQMIPKFGLGIHIEQFKVNDITDEYYIPITRFIFNYNINNHIRIEPEIGFNFGVNHNDNKNLGIGLGVFYIKPKKKLNIYGGLRIEYNKMKRSLGSQYSSSSKRETEKILAGPALGCEYFLGHHFSIGGELGLKLTYFFTTLDPGGMSDSNSFISSDTGLLLRFYF